MGNLLRLDEDVQRVVAFQGNTKTNPGMNASFSPGQFATRISNHPPKSNMGATLLTLCLLLSAMGTTAYSTGARSRTA